MVRHGKGDLRAAGAGQSNPLGLPGGKAVADAGACPDRDRLASLVLTRAGGGRVAVGYRHRVGGALRRLGGDGNGIGSGLALIVDGQSLLRRRLGGVKAADHIRRNGQSIRIAVGHAHLNGEASHVQGVSNLVLGLVGGAVDGNGVHHRVP